MEEMLGITLVALVITVIILLILAGVAMSLITGEGGLFARANHAGYRYNETAYNEAVNFNRLDALMAQYVGDDENDGTPTPTPTVTPTPPGVTTYETFEEGQEVMVAGESFYVLYESNSTENTVTLLAKYNLSNTPTNGHYMQLENSDGDDTVCNFSKTLYWEEDWDAYYSAESPEWNVFSDWCGDLLDLNACMVPTTGENAENSETSAILKARDYAIAVGGTNGRLLTKEEVEEFLYNNGGELMNPVMFERICGSQGEISQDFWCSSVGSGSEKKLIAYVEFQENNNYPNGNCGWIGFIGFDEAVVTEDYGDWVYMDIYYRIGVRPVITVNKSLVTSLTDILY